jgi:hypothetical protein
MRSSLAFSLIRRIPLPVYPNPVFPLHVSNFLQAVYKVESKCPQGTVPPVLHCPNPKRFERPFIPDRMYGARDSPLDLALLVPHVRRIKMFFSFTSLIEDEPITIYIPGRSRRGLILAPEEGPEHFHCVMEALQRREHVDRESEC